jgi:hypothetical protein
MSKSQHCYISGNLYAWSKKLKVFAIVEFAPDTGSFFKKRKLLLDFIQGTCYKVSGKFLTKFETMKKNKDKKKLIKKYKLENRKVLFKIEGLWTDEIKIDGEVYCKVSEIPQNLVAEFDRVLPSDSSLRPDLIAYKLDNLQAA